MSNTPLTPVAQQVCEKRHDEEEARVVALAGEEAPEPS